MKQFFKFMFASMLGTFLTGIILIIIFFFMVVGSIMGSLSSFSKIEDKKDIDENSVLRINLDGPILDRGGQKKMDFDFSGFKYFEKMGLNQILKAFDKAKNDKRIKGIYLNIDGVNTGMATMEEIRNGLIELRDSSDKFFLSYGKTYSQKSYYLSSIADRTYLYPEGGMSLTGLRTEIMFFKGFLEKFNLDMQIVRGKNNKFKSAVEPFMYKEMSDANRKQTKEFLTDLWDKMVTGISKERGLSKEKLNRIADSLLIRSAHDAEELGLFDGLLYEDEITDTLKSRLGLKSDEEVSFVELEDYIGEGVPKKYRVNKKKDQEKKKKDKEKDEGKVAVIYAMGGIEGGESKEGVLGSKTISNAIKEARKDTTIESIVLRVNSPGGSALASDVIWREVVLAKEEKPFIVSMGDLAASGGYYISCSADRIFASPNTLTGSIGVFGMIPNAKGFMNKSLGITFDRVKTNAHSDMGTVFKPLEDKEYRVIQESVEDVYDTFISKVAKGRGMTKAQVDSIGQGRVWSGEDAIEIGLVDELGGLEDAIAHAGEEAGLEDPEVVNYPKKKDPFKEFLENFKGEMNTTLLKQTLGKDMDQYRKYLYLRSIKDMEGIQARMPYFYDIK